MRRRRTIDPAKAAAAAGGDPGWYAGIPTPARAYHRCGVCDAESATVPGPGEACLVCKLKERKAAREASA
jgi:hypothetical protein